MHLTDSEIAESGFDVTMYRACERLIDYLNDMFGKHTGWLRVSIGDHITVSVNPEIASGTVKMIPLWWGGYPITVERRSPPVAL